MPTLRIRFPAGRYHATPWGHHVNEGLIEWPPSPWRLLRALLAAGYGALQWPNDRPPDVARSLVLKLANTLPRYCLPPASGAHSRHYMPLAKLDGGREKTTLVFDTWAHVGDGELLVQWDAVLTPEERKQLAQLASGLGYLGRSESWAEAELLDSDVPLPDGSACYPCDGAGSPGPGWEQISLLAPQPDVQYTQWRSQAVAAALADVPAVDASKKKLTKADKQLIERRNKAEAPFPADVLECMQVTTDWLRAHAWNQPPGSRKVFYWRRADALEVAVPASKPRSCTTPAVEAMLLSVSTASGNDNALPSIQRTLPQADLLHRALIGNAARRFAHSPVLSGCDEHRRPLTTRHEHAHLLHLDLDGDERLDHVLIWAPMGLDAQAQAIIRATRRTYTKGATEPLRLALAAAGDMKTIASLDDGLARLAGHRGDTMRWCSLTPFVPPRFLKRSGRNSLRGQVDAELASRGLPATASIEVLDPHTCDIARKARHYVRARKRGPRPPVDHGFMLELTFGTRVPGPLCLGYASHFGLGLFVPLQA